MALSDSRRKANDKYIKEHYARVALSMPKEEAAALRQYCDEHGVPVAGFIRQLIKDAISADDPGTGGHDHTGGVLCQPLAGGVTSPNTREEEKEPS